MGRDRDGELPAEAVPVALGWRVLVVLGPDHDRPDLAAAVVVPQQRAAGVGRVDDVGIGRLDGDLAALGQADGVAVLPGDDALDRAAGDADGAVVLLRAVDAVRRLVVGDDRVELGGGLVVYGAPGLAGVVGDARAAVVALDHAARVGRVDPEVVLVGVGHVDLLEGRAAVGRPERLGGKDVHGVWVHRVGEHVGVVPGPAAHVLGVVQLLPRLAAVVGTEEPAVRGLDEGPYPARPGRGYGDAYAPNDALWQAGPAGYLVPCIAAVGGAVESAAGAAAVHGPEGAPGLPHGGVEDARVVGVHRQVGRAGVLALVQDVVPGLAAVLRPEDAPLGAGAEGVTECGHVHEVGVVGMDADAGDVPGVLEPQVFPGGARVVRAVYAVAVGEVDADAGLAHAGVYDVGVGLGDGDRSDRRGIEVAVGDVLPVCSAVGGLPYAAAYRAEVEDARVDGITGDGDDATGPVGPDAAPFERAFEGFDGIWGIGGHCDWHLVRGSGRALGGRAEGVYYM